MSDIIKKITDTITETGKNVGEKTKQVGNTAKLNAKIIASERSISESYTLIGKYYYDMYKDNPDAELIELVKDIQVLRSEITIGSTNAFGTGGMETKLEAAEKVTEYGIPMILANGSEEKILSELQSGNKKATLFLAKE